MRKIALTVLALLSVTVGAFAQKLMIGEKAPDIKIKEWIGARPQMDGKPMLVEFFHSSNKNCIARLEVLDKTADTHKAKLEVLVLTKEPKDVIVGVIKPDGRKFFTGMDDAGKTFGNYSAQFVPFCVLIDRKGRVSWFGNASALTPELIRSVLE